MFLARYDWQRSAQECDRRGHREGERALGKARGWVSEGTSLAFVVVVDDVALLPAPLPPDSLARNPLASRDRWLCARGKHASTTTLTSSG